ncbi:MAG: arsenical pump-driving ATPase [Gemmatimonadaceae bacterium]|nr:arsenical pump-driving ATPase [Gemmatimonadaceae bacterium]
MTTISTTRAGRVGVPAPAAPTAPWVGHTTRHLFFTGKGGVGKTTVASATALRLAEAGRRTLIVSTDPASNLDDVFAMKAGTTPTPVPCVPTLWIMNLDPEAAAATYREKMVGPYRGVLPDAAVRSMEEQLSGACTVEIAAFNEFTALLADPALTRDFERVIFDTAPTGHTLRLLSLPSAWSGFLATSSSGASCLGPLAGLEEHKAQYAATVVALGDPTSTTVVLLTRPDVSALREAARAGGELAALGISNQRLVINGVLTGDADGDAVASTFIARQRRAVAAMPAALRGLPSADIPLIASNLTGVNALRAFARAAESTVDAESASLRQTVDTPISLRAIDGDAFAGFGSLEALIARIAADGHGVVMTMGKGGVGKTTLAATLALALARAGHRVHLSTTDPAAHIAAAVGDAAVAGLTVSRIDPVAETASYAAEVIATANEAARVVGGLDAGEQALLEEDLRSPCTEEIAVFRAFARTVAEAEGAFVVLDTAPTGHTLLLLDAAEAYHREIARTAAMQVPEAVRALLPRLRDPVYTKMLLVTLAEATPVHEASRLQEDLRRAGIEPFGWVVNASLSASGTRHPLLAARAALEAPHLARIRRELAGQAWVVPWRANS